MSQYRKSPRANFISYDVGDFFITICTKDKKHFFGRIADGEMHYSRIGGYVENQLSKCDEFCQEIEMIQYIVMPNHIHAIVRVVGNASESEIDSGLCQRSPNPSLRANPVCQRHVTALSKYVNSLKGAVTKYAKANGWEFGWQARYHDHLIRNTHDGNHISEYIANNVAKWQEDCFNS